MNNETLRDRLVDAYVAVIPFITLNILWIAVSLPIVTIIPSTAALLYATNEIAHGRAADWSTFFEGLRKWFLRSYLWGGLNLLVIAVLVSNLIFYAGIHAVWTTVATSIVVFLLVLWLLLQVSMFPLLLEQERPSLRLALRNSFVIVSKRPLQTVGTLLLIALIVGVTTFVIQPAWLFITASTCAYLANRATLGSVRTLMSVQPELPPNTAEPEL